MELEDIATFSGRIEIGTPNTMHLQVRALLPPQFYRGVLTQLSGSDYIGYDQKQRSIMVRDCKSVGNAMAATNDLKALRKPSPDVKPASVTPESVLG